MADQVLYSGVACITDLMVKEGLINLDFADVRAVMREMGKAMMGTGEAEGDKRALTAAEAAISNPLIDDASMKGARGLLISITGGRDLTLYEVDEAATRIREEVDQDANIIVGATFDESLDGMIRVSVVATGIDQACRNGRRAGGGAREWRRSPSASAPRTSAALGAEPARPRRRTGGAAMPCGTGNSGRRSGLGRCRHGGCACRGERVDQIGGQGGDRRGGRGRIDPSARAKAVVVHRSGRQRAGSRTSRTCSSRRRSFRRSRNGCRRAPCACRGSMSCRFRRRTRFAPGAARSRRTSIPKSAGCRCCSGWRRSASGVATRTNREAACRPRRGAPVSARYRPNGWPGGRCRGRPSRAPSA